MERGCFRVFVVWFGLVCSPGDCTWGAVHSRQAPYPSSPKQGFEIKLPGNSILETSVLGARSNQGLLSSSCVAECGLAVTRGLT